MNNRSIYLVPNSHIDPVWLWEKNEGIDEVLATFRAACARLDEYPDLTFTASSTIFYKWVEQYDPALFERVRRFVSQGRWEIVGAWVVEADCNLPQVESFMKSAEISRRYIESRFGVNIEVAYSPDTFGHPATMPAILADTGFKYYVYCRPGRHEKPDLEPSLFYWERDGKRVLCWRPGHHYSQGRRFPERFDEAIKSDHFLRDGLSMYMFGIGDHGGGPAKYEIEHAKKRMAEADGITIRFSSCLEFFHEAEKLPGIPTYSGDLHYHAIGCYSVNRAIKEGVRGAERALCAARRAMEVAGSVDDNRLDALWEKTIFNQFHDVLPGSCSPSAAKQAVAELDGVRDACVRMRYDAAKAVSMKIPVKCPQGEFRILNTLNHDVTGPFQLESAAYFVPGATFKDSTGRAIPIQEITPSVLCGSRRWMFIDTIPARSAKSYYFDSREVGHFTKREGSLYSPGDTVSIGDKSVSATGHVLLAGSPLFSVPLKLTVIQDDTDTWSHGVPGYPECSSEFGLVSSTISTGELAAFLFTRFAHGSSTAETRWTLYRNLPFIDLEINVLWTEHRSILKLELAPRESFAGLAAQCPGGWVEKYTHGQEEPLHGWVTAGNVGFAQDGAFAMDRMGNTLRMTLVRSSLFGYDRGYTIDENGPLHHTDQGEHSFRMRFVTDGDLSPDCMDALLAAFIEPFEPIRES